MLDTTHIRPAEVVATTGFRADIQGLRAVAVALVVLNHAGVPWLAGGYAGVDVFFVISGFLISGHLVSALRDNGRIDFARFYAARARRILPASLVVIVATTVAALLLLSPLRIATIVRDGIASALYLPNLLFATEKTDYLAGTTPSPFQHFWSLGIEEQFYLFWPLLLLALYLAARRSTGRLAIGISLVGALSFVACLLVANTSQPWAFFSLPTRAWELAAGALVACAAPALARVPPLTARLLAATGLATILASAVLFGAGTSYPGWATVAPVAGAALVLGFGRRVARGGVLGARPLQFLGALSYSLYLVHWPMLAILHERLPAGEPLPLATGLLVSALAVPLAYCLFRFVETPMRGRSSIHHRRVVAVGAAASIALAVCLAGAGAAASTLLPLHSGRAAPATVLSALPVGTGFVPSGVSPTLAAAVDDTGKLYTDGCQQGLTGSAVIRCSFGDRGSSTVVALFGDSHAGRWFPALEAAATRLGIRLDTFTKSGCRSEDTDGLWDRTGPCSTWRGAVVTALNAHPPDLIVLANHLGPRPDRDAARQQRDWEAGIDHAIERLPAGSRVLTLADSPQFATSPVLCLAENLNDTSGCAVSRAEAFNPAIAAAQRAVSARTGSGYLDLGDYFCDRTTCPPIIGSTLVYSDSHHLTATYSRALAPVLERELPAYLPKTR
ncbi:acyltransferase family protein [Lacisediminihabitans sp.]|uniref:acyltransferase family protein n=1 Tax=Lacisediminihabitans sp. TaxID=2787631 RepID=UPI00374D7D67